MLVRTGSDKMIVKIQQLILRKSNLLKFGEKKTNPEHFIMLMGDGKSLDDIVFEAAAILLRLRGRKTEL